MEMSRVIVKMAATLITPIMARPKPIRSPAFFSTEDISLLPMPSEMAQPMENALLINAISTNGGMIISKIITIPSPPDIAFITSKDPKIVLDASDIPDLVPIMAVVAAPNHGATFTNIQRLRLKESDRVATVEEMIRNLGGTAYSTESTLIVNGTGLVGGVVDSHNDHRIAMSAAIAATVCTSPVTILGAEAVNKSYPTFWEEYRRLGGHYEQYIR